MRHFLLADGDACQTTISRNEPVRYFLCVHDGEKVSIAKIGFSTMRSQTIERSTSVVQDFSSLGAQQFGAQANLSMAEQLPAAPLTLSSLLWNPKAIFSFQKPKSTCNISTSVLHRRQLSISDYRIGFWRTRGNPFGGS
jgi:hypothetical protein